MTSAGDSWLEATQALHRSKQAFVLCDFSAALEECKLGLRYLPRPPAKADAAQPLSLADAEAADKATEQFCIILLQCVSELSWHAEAAVVLEVYDGSRLPYELSRTWLQYLVEKGDLDGVKGLMLAYMHSEQPRRDILAASYGGMGAIEARK